MENYLNEILIEYVNFIEEYKSLIKCQNKSEDDFISIKNGEIGSYSFFYHGAGCRLEKDGIICEFDFLPENDFPIKFSSWKMYEFIKTNERWNKLKFSLDDVHTGLLKLVETKRLVLLEINGVSFPIFQVKV
ncbi:DUF6896 domain-containing protein [Pedobacter gandavensis]|uniref:DUF6896 domain-containing protein n=1 Tax=Pedobacter gandavensis TaxID=2679963 RepID=UPI00292FD454|nr:hypothetical protein [Pedobacter gandavensis]